MKKATIFVGGVIVGAAVTPVIIGTWVIRKGLNLVDSVSKTAEKVSEVIKDDEAVDKVAKSMSDKLSKENQEIMKDNIATIVNLAKKMNKDKSTEDVKKEEKSEETKTEQ